MAAKRRLEKNKEDRRPVVTDDFIYDDPLHMEPDDTVTGPVSDTPEEAVRKLRRKAPDSADPAPSAPSADSSSGSGPEDSGRSTVYSSGIMLDENLQPVTPPGRKPRRSHPVLRGIILVAVTLSLILTVALYS